MTRPKEAVYDEQISPLVSQIIQICQANRIGMVASFDLGDDEDGARLKCTTALLHDEYEPAPEMIEAARVLMSPPRIFAFTVSKHPLSE